MSAVFEIRYMDQKMKWQGRCIREELLSTDVTEVAVLDGIDSEGFGQMKLTVGKYKDNGIMKLKLLLEDRSNGYIYTAGTTDIQWNLRNLALLEVLDANDDGLSDIVIIAHYVTGVGEEGMSRSPLRNIYFQERHGFVRDTELEQKINKDELLQQRMVKLSGSTAHKFVRVRFQTAEKHVCSSIKRHPSCSVPFFRFCVEVVILLNRNET